MTRPPRSEVDKIVIAVVAARRNDPKVKMNTPWTKWPVGNTSKKRYYAPLSSALRSVFTEPTHRFNPPANIRNLLAGTSKMKDVAKLMHESFEKED